MVHQQDREHPESETGQVHHRHLHQNSRQLGPRRKAAGEGVGEQKLCRVAAFLLGQGGNAGKSGVERTAQPDDAAALDGVKAGEGTDVQPVHAESGGEAAHGSEHGPHFLHLTLKFRVHQNTDQHKKADAQGPNRQTQAALAQFMAKQGHAGSPPSA